VPSAHRIVGPACASREEAKGLSRLALGRGEPRIGERPRQLEPGRRACRHREDPLLEVPELAGSEDRLEQHVRDALRKPLLAQRLLSAGQAIGRDAQRPEAERPREPHTQGSETLEPISQVAGEAGGGGELTGLPLRARSAPCARSMEWRRASPIAWMRSFAAK
jgi:hypothetical protein